MKNDPNYTRIPYFIVALKLTEIVDGAVGEGMRNLWYVGTTGVPKAQRKRALLDTGTNIYLQSKTFPKL